MPWTFRQSTGELAHGGAVVGVGYAGHGEGKNNPALQNVHDVGPLPRGWYTVGKPFDSEAHGPYVMHLDPDPENEMFGRGGFLSHGDSIEHPGEASLGCMVHSRAVRQCLGTSPDRRLQVVE